MPKFFKKCSNFPLLAFHLSSPRRAELKMSETIGIQLNCPNLAEVNSCLAEQCDSEAGEKLRNRTEVN